MTASRRFRYKLELCPSCNGTGVQLEPVSTGKTLAAMRKNSGLSLKELGRRMGLSSVYLWNLENGRRRWTTQLRERFLQAVTE